MLPPFPVWLQILFATVATLTAVYFMWTKFLYPLLRFSARLQDMIPVINNATEAFKDAPYAFKVLYEIQAQFRTDSGSSMRDVINRLDEASIKGAEASKVLEVSIESARTLAERDREEFQRMLLLLDRTMQNQKLVAENLSVAQKAVDGVATDLADSHRRADEVPRSSEPGSAADAASKPPPTGE